MDTRKKLLSTAVAGLFAMGVAAHPTAAMAQPDESSGGGEKKAEANHCKGKGNHCGGHKKGHHGKGENSCKGENGCKGAKKKGEEHHEE